MAVRIVTTLALAAGLLGAALEPAAAMTALEVNEATFRPGPARDGPDPAVLRAQVLLDRLRFSPGSIDGRTGDNFGKALRAFAGARGLPDRPELGPETFTALVETYPGPVLVPYRVTAQDLKGPFIDKIPKDFEDMAELDALGYTSPREELAERFHVSPALLAALNPGAAFDTADEVVMVPAARPDPEPDRITNRNAVPARGGTAVAVRIQVDKAARDLRAFGENGRLLAVYPATIGSEEKPAPAGSFEIRAIARNPEYTYDPRYAFKGVKTKTKLTIPAGPNNPVGAVWLDLTAESYGIHGTPEPERVGKTFSHGCVRLTNWDVRDLASLAGKGTVVEFRE